MQKLNFWLMAFAASACLHQATRSLCGVFSEVVNRSASARLPSIIKVKPKAEYTKAALRRQVQGTVTLRLLLHSSGRLRTSEGFPYRLTKRAVEAAYRIEFEPAMKDGRPVSVTYMNLSLTSTRQ